MRKQTETKHLHTAAGQKLRSTMYEDDKSASRTDYCGAYVYINNELRYIHIPEGRITYTRLDHGYLKKQYEYHLTDHPSVDGQVFGNVRLTFTEGDNGQAEIIQVEAKRKSRTRFGKDHYYPFGLRMSGQHYSNTELLNKYLYNGKELQDQTGYYDYGFRQMDPALGRWFVVDAMAEKYASVRPYAYVSNNPLSFYDILGLEQQAMIMRDILAELWNNTGGGGVGTWLSGGGFSYYGSLGEAQSAGVEFPSINWGADSGGSGVSSSDVHANSFGGKLLSSGLVRNVLGFLGYNVSPYGGGYRLSWVSPATTTDTWNWDNNVTNSYSGLGTGNDYDIFAANRNSGGGGRGPGDPKKYPLVAWLLRNSPVFPVTGINPFFGAVAITSDVGFQAVGGEGDVGFIFVLAGQDAGTLKFYEEKAGGAGSDFGVGTEMARIDILEGKADNLRLIHFEGQRYKLYGGADVFGFLSAGGSLTYSEPRSGMRLLATGLSSGIGLSVLGAVFAGSNVGMISFMD